MLTTIILGFCLSSVGLGQSSVSLTDAHAVDLKVAWAGWSPMGDCLAYSKTEDSGIAIGLYPAGAPQGSILLHLMKSDTWNLQWFGGLDAAIVTVNSSDSQGKRLSMFLLESKPASAIKLFDQVAGPNDNLSIDASLSPLLEHAIFAVHVGDVYYHCILPQGGTALARSNDLDIAEHQGLIGPKWASSGTAFYMDRKTADATYASMSPNGGSSRDQFLRAIIRSEEASAAASAKDSSEAAQDGVVILSGSLVQSLKDQLTPAPAAGNVGLELMPDVGVLRQVRSPGPYDVSDRGDVTSPERQSANVIAGPLTANSPSLWLRSTDKKWAVLVALAVESSWLSPGEQNVAYTVGGALFVRSLKF